MAQATQCRRRGNMAQWLSITTSRDRYPGGKIWLCGTCAEKYRSVRFDSAARRENLDEICRNGWDDTWKLRQVILNYTQVGDHGVMNLVSGQEVASINLAKKDEEAPPWREESYYDLVHRMMGEVRRKLRSKEVDREKWYCADCDSKGGVNLGRGGEPMRFAVMTQKGARVWSGELWPRVAGYTEYPESALQGSEVGFMYRSSDFYKTVKREQLERWRMEGFPVPLEARLQRNMEGGILQFPRGDHRLFPWKRGICCHAKVAGRRCKFPWGLGDNRTVEGPKGMEAWVMACFTCHKEYCESSEHEDECDSCGRCGWATCVKCRRDGVHDRVCPGNWDQFGTSKAASSERREPVDAVMRKKAKESFKCHVSTCRAKRELGYTAGNNQTCASCHRVPCQDGECKSALRTIGCSCYGRLDVCGFCVRPEEERQVGCWRCVEKGHRTILETELSRRVREGARQV